MVGRIDMWNNGTYAIRLEGLVLGSIDLEKVLTPDITQPAPHSYFYVKYEGGCTFNVSENRVASTAEALTEHGIELTDLANLHRLYKTVVLICAGGRKDTATSAINTFASRISLEERDLKMPEQLARMQLLVAIDSHNIR